jgi:hypothetical protein
MFWFQAFGFEWVNLCAAYCWAWQALEKKGFPPEAVSRALQATAPMVGLSDWSRGPYRLSSTGALDHTPYKGCRHSRGLSDWSRGPYRLSSTGVLLAQKLAKKLCQNFAKTVF